MAGSFAWFLLPNPGLFLTKDQAVTKTFADPVIKNLEEPVAVLTCTTLLSISLGTQRDQKCDQLMTMLFWFFPHLLSLFITLEFCLKLPLSCSQGLCFLAPLWPGAGAGVSGASSMRVAGGWGWSGPG